MTPLSVNICATKDISGMHTCAWMGAKVFLLVVLLTVTDAYPQDKSKDDYFVGFFAEEINIGAPVGHAFIGIGKGTPLTCSVDGGDTEMVGFYPKRKIVGGKSYWYGPVESQVRSDVRTKIDRYVFRKITFADYLKVQLRIAEWNKKQYELGRQDCISFFIDVASLFDDIELPDRAKYTLPDEYVSTFILLNK